MNIQGFLPKNPPVPSRFNLTRHKGLTLLAYMAEFVWRAYPDMMHRAVVQLPKPPKPAHDERLSVGCISQVPDEHRISLATASSTIREWRRKAGNLAQTTEYVRVNSLPPATDAVVTMAELLEHGPQVIQLLWREALLDWPAFERKAVMKGMPVYHKRPLLKRQARGDYRVPSAV